MYTFLNKNPCIFLSFIKPDLPKAANDDCCIIKSTSDGLITELFNLILLISFNTIGYINSRFGTFKSSTQFPR